MFDSEKSAAGGGGGGHGMNRSWTEGVDTIERCAAAALAPYTE